MNERRLESAGDATRDAFETDLRALGRETARDLPPLDAFVRAAATRPRAAERRLPSPLELLHGRPWIPTGLAGAIVAVALLVVPLSYERTTGHTVRLALSGGAIDAGRAEAIARQMQRLLHAGGVSLRIDRVDGTATYTLAATVPNAAGVNVTATATAFCAELGRIGYRAAAIVAPVKERVSGSVYAYARDRVIAVSIDGKSAAQLETEIRQALTDAGVPSPKVSVSRSDVDGKHEIDFTVDALKTGAHPNEHGAQEAPEVLPKLVLEHDGAAIGGDGFSVREELRRNADGTTLVLHIQDGAKTADVSIPHSDAMGDVELDARVRSQLRAAGIAAKVTVTNGRVQISNHP